MQAPFALSVYRDDLARIVQMVFQTMMNTDVEAAATPWVRPSEHVTSAVQFVGEWQGATLFECGAQQACEFATLFMGIDKPAAIDSDVRDVMGELANMVAGNLKSLLPRGVDLSIPSVVEGSDYTMSLCGIKAVEQISFVSPSGDFRITLVEMSPSGR
ncbi:MAG TPA: chemotaxis protein CheX [Bryobacteraceae bacterium]|nr:chemotaxis protein CheX [Bryobacteraceae bacterium]